MAKGNVELWLGELLNQAMHSLHAVIRDAYHAINDGGFQLMSFLGQFPSQVRLYDFLPFYMCYCGVFTLVFLDVLLDIHHPILQLHDLL